MIKTLRPCTGKPVSLRRFPPWEYCVSSMGTNHIQYWNNQKYRHIIKENITNITTNITKLSPYSIGICVSLVML